MVMMRRSMRPSVSLVFMFDYLDDIIDGVGETDFVMITSVMPSSGAWCTSVYEKKYIIFAAHLDTSMC